jgi:hypothetical protein
LSEEQEKPKRWYKNKQWLTIDALVFLICLIASAWAITRGVESPSTEYYYGVFKHNVQNAVQDYQDKNEGNLPIVNGTVTVNSSLYRIIDICALLVSEGGKLNQVSDNCASINGANNDNCDAGCEGCTEYSHYIWIVNESGHVYSTCVGLNCSTYNKSGYQGIWP